MPGPRKAAASTSLSSKEETEHVKQMGMRKVRVICTDPDATDSSSDERDDELKKGPVQKRVVREMLIPALVSVQEGAEESLYAGSIRDYKLDPTMPHSSSLYALPVLSYKRNLSRTSSKRSPKRWRLRQVNSMSTSPQDPLAETGKKACRYIGVRQRRWGKWTAELREPSQGLRMWLGTFDSAKEAAIAYDEAARKLKGAEAITNFGVPSPSSSFPSPDAHQLGQLGILSSDRWPAAEMCVDDDALLLSCADLEAVEECLLAYSPSSVLERSISSDSGVPLCSPSSVLESAFIDDGASAPFRASDTGMAGGKGLEECYSSRHMPLRDVDEHNVSLDASRGKMDHSFKHEPSALEEPFFEVLEELFDCEGSNFAREGGLTRPELVSFENLSEDEGANLMSFDLDAEALTWINIQP